MPGLYVHSADVRSITSQSEGSFFVSFVFQNTIFVHCVIAIPDIILN